MSEKKEAPTSSQKSYLEIGSTTLPKGHSLSFSGVEPTLKTFPVPPPDSIMSRVKNFLPVIQASNDALPPQPQQGQDEGGDVDMGAGGSEQPRRHDPYWNGDVSEDQPHIEMDLSFLPCEITEDAITSAIGMEETPEELLMEEEPEGGNRKRRNRGIEEMD